jgi:hypothetical protein
MVPASERGLPDKVTSTKPDYTNIPEEMAFTLNSLVGQVEMITKTLSLLE